jgi:hypothetical protein
VAGYEAGETPGRQEVAAGGDAQVAGRDDRSTLPREAREESGPGSGFGGAAGVQVGSRNVQVNNYFYGAPVRISDGGAPSVHPPGRAGPAHPDPAGWLLSEVRDPFALEVHRPVRPEGLPPGLPMLPAYVPREHDDDVAQAVRRAAEGHSEITVLVGGSSTGKTRACWEALSLLRSQPEPWRLWHPIAPTRPDAALRELSAIGPRTVVWLNEAQFYLDVTDGMGERVAAGLRELLRDPARAPVLVLATLWPQFWDVLTACPRPGADPHAQARELLAGNDITVPATFTPAQVGQLAEAEDGRLALAARLAADGQVVQFLAGTPELMARYRNAPPAARALIDAAMDARRLGMGAGLSRAFLEAAVPGYLTDADWDAAGEDWAEQAFAYASVPCKGARGPLTRIRPRPGPPSAGKAVQGDRDQPGALAGTSGSPVYRLADYLDQYGRAHRREEIPPGEFWAGTARHAVPADQAALGQAAHERGLYRAAAQLNKNAAATGNPGAASYLAHLPGCLRDDSRPRLWAAAHASIEEPGAVASLVGSLRVIGARDQLTALADRAAGRTPLSDWSGVLRLLEQLRKADAREQLIIVADRAADQIPLDETLLVARLLDELREAGAHEQITALLARDPAAQVAIDRPDHVDRLLGSLREAGGDKQAAALVNRIAVLAARAATDIPLDAPGEIAALVEALRALRAHEQVAALLARDPGTHVPTEDPAAVAKLMSNLRQVRFGMTEAHEQAVIQQVTTLARRAADHAPLGEPTGLAALLEELAQEPWTREHLTMLLDRDPAAHAALDDPHGVARLLGKLPWRGRDEQVSRLLARDPATHVPLRDWRSVLELLDTLRRADSFGHFAAAREQFTVLAHRIIPQMPLDATGTVVTLLRCLLEADAHQQVAALLARDPAAHGALDDPYDVAGLLNNLRKADAHQQVATLLARDPAAHVIPQGNFSTGVPQLLYSLRQAGADDQARLLISRLPAFGMFYQFNNEQGIAGRFHFGREQDGSPSAPWGWEDLD